MCLQQRGYPGLAFNTGLPTEVSPSDEDIHCHNLTSKRCKNIRSIDDVDDVHSAAGESSELGCIRILQLSGTDRSTVGRTWSEQEAAAAAAQATLSTSAESVWDRRLCWPADR